MYRSTPAVANATSDPSCSIRRSDDYDGDGDTFTVPGAATIQAKPHRRRREARELADRIAANARDYLPVIAALGVPGVTDLRPISHARGGSSFGYLLDRCPPPPSPRTATDQQAARLIALARSLRV